MSDAENITELIEIGIIALATLLYLLRHFGILPERHHHD